MSSLCDYERLSATDAAAALATAGARGVLVRGSGCSYGDAALNTGGTALTLAPEDPTVLPHGVVVAGAGTSFETLLRTILPTGWTLPVLPGTRHLTLGGAIAADVHGKNHLQDGSIATWLDEVVLLDGAGRRWVTRPGDPEFAATVGGMGLTGMILGATLRLLPAEGTHVEVSNQRLPDLDKVMAALDVAARRSRYAVAWVDAFARGRGVVSEARWTGSPFRKPYSPTQHLVAPPVPLSVVTPLTARTFNAAWWRLPGHQRSSVTTLTSFFHPLDGVRQWNRLYGPRGFLQYQFVVPDDAAHLVGDALGELTAAGGVPFLGVLKRFGDASEGLLSFPRPGWSLAVDLPPTSGLGAVLDRLDNRVAAAGGAVYLAKDARLSAELVEDMYPHVKEWRDVQSRLDPEGLFRSDLDRRLGLVRRA
jgi:decaprenylphospho-beta-D-ribofuranose 2-oxidase